MPKPGHILALVLVLLAAGPPALATPRWRRPVAPPPMPVAEVSGFARVNGIRMYYAFYGKGNGSPIVLLHGGMASADVWGYEIPPLAENHEVIVADSRGQGRSTRTREPLNYHLMAEDYVALLDHLGIARTALVGWSDGGIIGLDIAMNHPDRLSKLFAQAANVTPSGLTSIPNVDAPTVRDTGVHETYAADDQRSRSWQHNAVLERAMRRLWATEPNYTAADLAAIRVPTEIVVGDHDEVIRPQHTAYIADSIPGARLVTLKNVSHPALFQDPAQYVKAIDDFIGDDR